MKKLPEQLIAEFVAVLLFVFIGAGSVVILSALASGAGPVGLAIAIPGIALAHGLAMGILVSNTGHISGGHHNPAVTISVWVAGKIETARAGAYIVVQLAGAAAGAWLLSVTIPKKIWESSHLGATLINPQATALGFSPGRGVLLEAILTFVLVFVVFGTAIDERGVFKSIAGLAIGFAILVDILVGAFFTGASMNPARSFGPALVSGTWTDFWVYIVGPLTGGIIAASVYWFAFLRNRPEPTVDTQLKEGDLLVEAEPGEPEPPYEQPIVAGEDPPPAPSS